MVFRCPFPMSEGAKADLQESGVGQLFGDAFALNVENGTHVVSEEKYAVRVFRNVVQHVDCSQKAVASGAGFPFQALFWRLFVGSRCLSDRSGILGACFQQDPRSLSGYLLERLGLETHVLQSPSHRVSDEVSFG